MRALLLTFALFAFSALNLLGTDHARLADAIRIEEGYVGRPGALGEEGPYQIRAITWRQHMQPHCTGVACSLCRDFATDDGRELRTNPGPRARGNGAALPFALAREERYARACALKHLAWLAAKLEARGVPASPFNLAAAWNAGLARYTSGRAPERAYHYALRVELLYLTSGRLQSRPHDAVCIVHPRSARELSPLIGRAPEECVCRAPTNVRIGSNL